MLNINQLVDLVDLLDVDSREAIETIIKNRIVMSDPDFVKLTPEERQKLDDALESDDYIDFNEFKESFSSVEKR